MKKIISGLCAISIFFNTASAFVTYEIPYIEEKIIPINFVSDEDESQEYIDLSEYKNAKILDYDMAKGDLIAQIKDEELILDLYDGVYFNGQTIQEKIKVEEIEDLIIKNNKATFIPEETVKNIIEVEGDFESGTIEGDKVILKLAEGATGIKGYNKEKITKSNLTIEVDKNNNEETIYSEFYEIGEEMPDDSNIKVKNTNLNANATVEFDDGQVRVLFTDGTPNINKTIKNDGYGYYWIDRALDGTFREKYPNSIYRSDRYYFEGRGAYIEDERLIIEREFEDNWKDYVGFTLGGQKYIYLLSNVSEDLFADCIILDEKVNIFDSKSFSTECRLDWMNTDKLTVEITDDSVKYIPEGVLYSMGELVAYSEGWGETIPNRSDESTESFFNIISGRMETYVKHFKFFYGPKKKETFGGTVTYPYKTTIEYEHYEPTNLYNGMITYTYEDIVEDSGYEFNGWIKISYEDTKSVNDYPPQAPYNVSYNRANGFLEWQPAIDDYTKPENIAYEVEIESSGVFNKVGTTKGVETINYADGTRKKFRVRGKDSQNQFSEWAYSDESSIEIIGNVTPTEVLVGESVDIAATVKSLKDIKSVQAFSEELNINEELLNVSQKTPNAVEVSFNLLNYTGKTPLLILEDMVYGVVEGESINIKNYYPDTETNRSTLDIKLPDNILFNKTGTVILPNQNYTNTPSEITTYNGNVWYFDSACGLNFINKTTGKEESFIKFENDNKAYLVGNRENVEITPYITINLFDNEKYEKILVSSDVATKPIAVTWTTKNNVTEFIVYIDGEVVHSYQVDTEKVLNSIDKFSSYNLSKRMEKMQRNSVGYQYATKSKSYTWAAMYQAGNTSNMPWLGYKLTYKNNSTLYEEYNNLTTTRDVNRLVFLDESISDNSINLYLSKIESTNLLIDRRNKETVFADEIQERILEYSKENVVIGENIEGGAYNVTLVATSVDGETAKVSIPLIVKTKPLPKINEDDINIGRFFYKNNNLNAKCVEELSLTKFNLDTKGFISAGETLAIVINSEEEIEKIVVDFIGDKSIKEYDELTEKLLGYKLNYEFPLTIYPTDEGVFLYKIPYKTKQTLESWATLREKSEDYESIDKAKLFSRILEPYKIKILANGEEFVFEIDVFERWDTILNRDASKYITNANQKWRIKL